MCLKHNFSLIITQIRGFQQMLKFSLVAYYPWRPGRDIEYYFLDYPIREILSFVFLLFLISCKICPVLLAPTIKVQMLSWSQLTQLDKPLCTGAVERDFPPSAEVGRGIPSSSAVKDTCRGSLPCQSQKVKLHQCVCSGHIPTTVT